jgi:RNA polymerase sigma-70 factor (ECF subfamily)
VIGVTDATSHRGGAVAACRQLQKSLAMNRSGNASLERLFQAHAESLYAFLVYRTGDRQLAADLLADTFERALRSSSRFDASRGSEKNWVYAIAVNLVRDHARRQRTEMSALELVGAHDSRRVNDGGLGAVEDRDLLVRALTTLSDDEREAIALRFGSDLKLREVARVLGDQESAVEKRISRALKKLREALQSRE